MAVEGDTGALVARHRARDRGRHAHRAGDLAVTTAAVAVALIATSTALPWVWGVAVSIAVGLMFVGAFWTNGDQPSSIDKTVQTTSSQRPTSSANKHSVARAIAVAALLAFIVTSSVAELDAPHFASIGLGVAVYVVVAALLLIPDEKRRVD